MEMPLAKVGSPWSVRTCMPSKKIQRTGSPLAWSAQYLMKPSDLVHTSQGLASTVSEPR